MSHTLTLSFATITELQAAVNLLAGNDHATPATATPGKGETVKASSTKLAASADAGAEKPKPAAEKPKAETPAEDPAKTVEPFPYADLQKAVMNLVAVDPTGPKAVLKELGIETFKGSDPALWAKGKQLLEAALAAKEAA